MRDARSLSGLGFKLEVVLPLAGSLRGLFYAGTLSEYYKMNPYDRM